ncbi:hypothetical protein HO173_006099 [Letharia columbiana]|uniref:Uncharacterized protein n=1 Tax=Letharia columbiana TaxID=112416 RepID=A0A8H6FW51_9LECA|nr:uncharacterized protein HO173_006099 [Letharia columbiana]KAF6235903.1 hypothetical protein HO173_006099 [Letharia columbiana]
MPPINRLPASPGDADADADLARAFQELAKGERTASAMETQLTALERKIDELLATVASADDRGAEVDRASTETIGNVTGAGEDQSERK